MKRQVVIPAPPTTGASLPSPSSSSWTVPTILEIKQAHQRSARLVNASRNRVVCRFWTEKLLSIVDALQLFALLWQLSQPWPWPARWLAWTRWTNAFNLDIFSFGARGAAMGATLQPFSHWGEMHRYWVYALAFSLVPFVLVGALWMAPQYWNTQGREDFLTRRFVWSNGLVHVLYVLYLPVGLAVVRLVNCDLDGRVSVDPITFPTCWSMSHVLAVVWITCIAGGSFLVGFPLWLSRTITRAVFTTDRDEHERFLQSTELAYVLGTSDAYMDLCMPAFASFRVHGAQTWVQMCVTKLVLLAVFSFLRSPSPSTTNQGLQGSLFFAGLLLLAWRQTWRPAYRVASTNQLATLLSWLLVANGAIALLCANGVRSALTVSTSVNASLSFVNLVLLSTIALSLGQSLRQWSHRQELTALPEATLRAEHACWPTHPLMDEIISDRVPLEQWILLLQDVRALCLRTALAAPTMKPFHELANQAKQLEACWREAQACDHPLAVHLHQELLLLSDLYVDAIAMSPIRDMNVQADHEADFVALANRLRRRDGAERLLPPAQRRVLSNLRAVSTWSTASQQGGEPGKEQPDG